VLLPLLSMFVCRLAPGVSRKRIFVGLPLVFSHPLPPMLLSPETTTGNRPKARQKCTMLAPTLHCPCLTRHPFAARRPLRRVPRHRILRLLRHNTGEESDEFKPRSRNAGDVVRALDCLLLLPCWFTFATSNTLFSENVSVEFNFLAASIGELSQFCRLDFQ
jgi:hypothetical protein